MRAPPEDEDENAPKSEEEIEQREYDPRREELPRPIASGCRPCGVIALPADRSVAIRLPPVTSIVAGPAAFWPLGAAFDRTHASPARHPIRAD